MKYPGSKGFSLVETLVAAAVVSLAVIMVIAIIRKGQDQMAVDNHRRIARLIADTTLEGERFLPVNYSSVPLTIAADSVQLESNLKAKRSFSVVQNNSIANIPKKKITVFINWTEPGTSANESVQIERWIPYLAERGYNIAPFASGISASSEYSGVVSGKTHNCIRSNIADGIIGGNYDGDWASFNQQSPWIELNWPAAHKIRKIALYDRNSLDDFARNATITFSDGSPPIATTIPDRGSKTLIFFPKTVTWVHIQLNGSGNGNFNVGLSEVEVFE